MRAPEECQHRIHWWLAYSFSWFLSFCSSFLSCVCCKPFITARCVLETYATITCGVGLHIKEVLELAGGGQPLVEFQKATMKSLGGRIQKECKVARRAVDANDLPT